jgi:UDP-perosamine 4-acetyltransferase
MPIPVVGLGAGGHAQVVIEILRLNDTYDIIGLLDPDPSLQGQAVLDVSVLGDDSCLPTLYEQGICHFFIGLGSVGNPALRRRLSAMALELGMHPIQAVHPQAMVSPSASLETGVTVMAGAIINASVAIGMNAIINTGAIVEHDCVLGDFVHIATGARLASTVQVADDAHVGAGATVRQCVTIGAGAIVGAGAVVVKDVAPHTVVVGVPARPRTCYKTK